MGSLAENADCAALDKRLWVGLHEEGPFQSFKRRPYGRGAPELSGRDLSPVEVWRMVQRRAEAAGLDPHFCNHT
jgi:hypothetical protein